MNRIAKTFSKLMAQQRVALVPYVTAGDPHLDVTLPLMHEMVAAGADIIELGVPFSDPMADGPVIQKAAERALINNVSLRDVLSLVKKFRADDNITPVVLMGYLNPVEVMGYEVFAQQAVEAGVDGVLTVDIPPEEAGDLLVALKNNQIDPIFLLAPTTNEARINKICTVASGYVYYVSLKGVTGASTLDIASVEEKVNIISSITDLPIGVGFGIKDAESAAAVAKVADAVVVGSAIINIVERFAQDSSKMASEIKQLLGSMRAALDADH